MKVRLPENTLVVALYRPGQAGRTLAADDPRAWANTGAFPTPTPDPETVTNFVNRLPPGIRDFETPVEWTHYDGDTYIRWEPTGSLNYIGETLTLVPLTHLARQIAIDHGTQWVIVDCDVNNFIKEGPRTYLRLESVNSKVTTLILNGDDPNWGVK